MRHEIDFNNKYRVLLTEVIPYELPLMLNNDAFYENMLDDSLRESFKKIFNGQLKGGWTIPFDYSLRRAGGEKSRKFSLMHPMTQLDVVEHYAKYDEYMISLCSHSPFSIHYISKIARCVFFSNDDQDISEDAEEQYEEIEHAEAEIQYKSYFHYKKYDLSYKFFESGDNLRLEQKYPCMMSLDVANCFYHIYTHSVAWAIKGKEIAKNSTNNDTFEKSFDTLMQHSNYNETNGILVGPEVSRIFAEIIFQAIDLAIMRKLKDQYGYKLGYDYEIRRYVDDSYVYATKREVLENICSVYKEQLAFYKLDINMSKLQFYERPFTTEIADAKRQIKKMVSEFKTNHLVVGDDGLYVNPVHSGMALFTSFVKQFRSVAHQYKQSYGTLNKYMLLLLLKQIRSESKRIPSQELLIAYVEISFYIFSLDMHTTASYRLCAILDSLVQWAEKNPDQTVKQELVNRMRREAKRVLDIYQTGLSHGETNLEAQNLLITMNRLTGLQITESMIENLFELDMKEERGFDKLNYFQICTLLYIIEDSHELAHIQEHLENEIVTRLSSPAILRKSELTHLFLDVMTCPFIKKSVKTEIVKQCIGCTDSNAGKRRKELEKPGRWFFDWDKSNSLTRVLKKKEYHSPYE